MSLIQLIRALENTAHFAHEVHFDTSTNAGRPSSALEFLNALEVLTLGIDDVSPIEDVSNLRSLNLDRSGKNCPDLRLLTSLQDLFMQWRRGSSTVFDCKSLVGLYVTQYPGKSTSDFAISPI
jgi:hypothetical protein